MFQAASCVQLQKRRTDVEQARGCARAASRSCRVPRCVSRAAAAACLRDDTFSRRSATIRAMAVALLGRGAPRGSSFEAMTGIGTGRGRLWRQPLDCRRDTAPHVEQSFGIGLGDHHGAIALQQLLGDRMIEQREQPSEVTLHVQQSGQLFSAACRAATRSTPRRTSSNVPNPPKAR